jgi:antitoxin Phd
MIEVIFMMVNTNAMVSISEANQNFSRIARMVDEKGSVIIMKNNAPRYLLVEFSQAETMQAASDEDVLAVSARLINRNRQAYEELAK